jgi:hypothetical protein
MFPVDRRGAFWALLGTVDGWLYDRLGARRLEA